MAIFNFSSAGFPRAFDQRNVDFGELFSYDHLDYSPTLLRFFDNQAFSTTFTGRDVTLEFAGGQLVAVTGGTITGLVERDAGLNSIIVTGLDISASDFADRVFARDNRGAVTLLTAGNDRMTGTDAGDWLNAGGGNDRLIGGGGNDSLVGGAGNDTLAGKVGADVLAGGQGADDFLFDTSPTRADRIADFARNVDDILLENSAFAGLGAAGALGGRYVEGAGPRDSQDRVIYTQSTGEIWFDRDGTGAADRVLVARVTAGTDLSAADFLVV